MNSQMIYYIIGNLMMFFGVSTPLPDSISQSHNQYDFEVVQIGDQTWMAENLTVTVPGSKCAFDDYNQRDDCEIYGRYYTWEAAKRAAEKIDGWRLPRNQDFIKLVNNLGGQSDAYYNLKEKGRSGFEAKFAGFFVPITVATNDYYGSEKGDFENTGISGMFWSYEPASYRSTGSCLIISRFKKMATIGNAYSKRKLSVRLIKE